MTVVCPNDKCEAYLILDDINVNRVQCGRCKSEWFCKLCRRKWLTSGIHDNHMLCGYDDCDSAPAILETLGNCPRRDYGIEKNVPSIRLCPNCKRYVYWKDACKHSTCTECNYKFCFVCLATGHKCCLGTPCAVKEQRPRNEVKNNEVKSNEVTNNEVTNNEVKNKSNDHDTPTGGILSYLWSWWYS